MPSLRSTQTTHIENNGQVPKVAYFSMEIAVEPRFPTYSGGLGVLAGDTLRSAADLGVPMVAVTLAHRKGYFHQTLDQHGNQQEVAEMWDPPTSLKHLPESVTVMVEDRSVRVTAWVYEVKGLFGHTVPVYLLDTYCTQNSPYDATLTDYLYGGDEHYRLCQEVILGMGGWAMLRQLGYEQITSFHINEGHSALLGLALLQSELERSKTLRPGSTEIDAVWQRCVFTTHTPVPAGHDRFSADLAQRVLGAERFRLISEVNGLSDGMLNMTYFALQFSHYINGVAMHHGEVSRSMFPDYPIRAITNGIHAVTWTAPPFQNLFDRYIPEWRSDNHYLRYALGMPLAEIASAHAESKGDLIRAVQEKTHLELNPKFMIIGFARRAATYKRFDLLFSDPERLKKIAREVGPLQIVYGGKAHPRDEGGKQAIRNVFSIASALHGSVNIVYVEDYGMDWAKLFTSGSDLWLNTPQHPQEASGTSGMKAAINGVPSLSIRDGWWVEGHIEGVTGWAIGEAEPSGNWNEEGASLYDKLERSILPMYYGRRDAYTSIRRFAIALNGAFFNTHRMVLQYVANAYRDVAEPSKSVPT